MRAFRKLLFWSIAPLLLLLPKVCAAQERSIYPLNEGTIWIYSGSADWTVPNTSPGRVRSGKLRWTTEVVKTFSAPGVTAAVMKGFPFELAWYDPTETIPGYSVIVETGEGLYHAYVRNEAEGELEAQRVITGQVAPVRADQLLEYPIRVGACLDDGDTAAELIAAHRYCWFVRREAKVRQALGWDLTYETLPDDMSFRLVPQVGITRFSYHHHGTVANTEAQLINFRLAIKH